MPPRFIFRQVSDRVDVEWVIRNFPSLPKKRELLLESPSFVVDDAKFYIRMYPNEPVYVLVGMGRKFPRFGAYHLCYEIKFKKGDELLVSSQPQEYNFRTNNSHMSIMNQFLVRGQNRELDFDLTILCTCFRKVDDKSFMSETKKDENASEGVDSKIPKGIETLLQNLKDLYLSGLGSDITIKVGDEEFRAHRSILAARSSVFASMFQHDMMEKNSGVVNIVDCDPESFKDFLAYLYTANFSDISPDNIPKLYILASKYDLPELRTDCAQFLNRTMTVNSFCDVVVTASMFDEPQFMDSAVNFFTYNFKKILRSKTWDEFVFDYPTLARELFEDVTKMKGCKIPSTTPSREISQSHLNPLDE